MLVSTCYAQTNSSDCPIEFQREDVEVLPDDTYLYTGLKYEGTRKSIKSLNIRDNSLEFANFFDSYMPNIDLQKIRIARANFVASQLPYANLQQVDGAGANFTLTNLCGVSFHKAGLFGASFSQVDLSHSDLSFANFSMVNLQSTNLTSANLEGAIFVNGTIDTETLTFKQLSKVGSLHNTILLKKNSSTLMGPTSPYSIDTVMTDRLKEAHPKLFDEVPITVWLQGHQYSSHYVWNWVTKGIVHPVE